METGWLGEQVSGEGLLWKALLALWLLSLILAQILFLAKGLRFTKESFGLLPSFNMFGFVPPASKPIFKYRFIAGGEPRPWLNLDFDRHFVPRRALFHPELPLKKLLGGLMSGLLRRDPAQRSAHPLVEEFKDLVRTQRRPAGVIEAEYALVTLDDQTQAETVEFESGRFEL